ncbi:MAG: ABC transporter permease [Armatimonadetes bacterium]|nr:ABC transporter permease [Armatimonadota bacterium]
MTQTVDSGAGSAARWRTLLVGRQASVVFVIVLLCAAMLFTDAREAFYSQRNLLNVSRQVSLLAIIAIGETLVIITSGIDLSVGSLIAFAGMTVALLVTRMGAVLEPWAAVSLAALLTLAVSLGIGAIHAAMVHLLRLPPFVVTLASLLILRSQALVMNDQLPITLEKWPALLFLANGNLFEGSAIAIPVPVVIMAVVAVTAGLCLGRTRMGRYLYSVGSNETATRLSGVSVFGVKLFAYGASALVGGMAGILWASYGGQGDPLAGQSYELDAVAASVVGGANLNGGQGTVQGTLLGSVLLMLIFSAINLTLSKPDLWRGSVVGGVLLLAVLVTALQQRRRGAQA